MTTIDDLDPALDLVLTRDLNAPRDVIYTCWTTPEHLMQWFVPKPHRVTACTLDVRPGGACNTTLDVNGKIMQNNGVYLEIVPNEKIVFTDTYSAGWKPAPDPFMTAIITFQDLGNGRTRYQAVVRHRTAAAAKTHAEMGFQDGWGTVAAQFEAYAQGISMKTETEGRTMVITRMIAAPVAVVWGAWMNADTLPQWWGPDGFSCRTTRIDLRAAGEWVFDMIGPDGTVYPNHHRYGEFVPLERIAYTLLRGENGPDHAEAVVTFDNLSGATRVTLRMTFATNEEYHAAMAFGAQTLGLQTLGKLARFAG